MKINEKLSRRIVKDSIVLINGCFKNAWYAMVNNPDLQNSTYCLGYYELENNKQLYQHAWLIRDNEIIDPTIFAENSEPSNLNEINYHIIFSLSFDEINSIYQDKGITRDFSLDIYVNNFPEKKSIYKNKNEQLIYDGYEISNQEESDNLLLTIEKEKYIYILEIAIEDYVKKYPNIDQSALSAIIPILQDNESISIDMLDLACDILDNSNYVENLETFQSDDFESWVYRDYKIQDEE